MNALRKKLSMDRLVKRRGVQSVQYNYPKEATAVVHVRLHTNPSEEQLEIITRCEGDSSFELEGRQLC